MKLREQSGTLGTRRTWTLPSLPSVEFTNPYDKVIDAVSISLDVPEAEIRAGDVQLDAQDLRHLFCEVGIVVDNEDISNILGSEHGKMKVGRLLGDEDGSSLGAASPNNKDTGADANDKDGDGNKDSDFDLADLHRDAAPFWRQFYELFAREMVMFNSL